MTTNKVLFSATVVMAIVAAAGCCRKPSTDDTSASGAGGTAATAATTDPAAAAAQNPDWRMKCPQADQVQGGTAIGTHDCGIHTDPDQNSQHKAGLARGTMVNIIASKGNWYCIDFPCATGLCPGWVETKDVERRAFPVVIRDSGVVATPDAAAITPPTPEAGTPVKPDAATPTGAAGGGGGSSKTPPAGSRPPTIKLPK